MDNDTDLIYEVVGRNLKRLRKARKLTQVQLAERSGVENRHISAIERNKSKLSLATFMNLVKGLDADARDLLGQEIVPMTFDEKLQINLREAPPEIQELCLELCRTVLSSYAHKKRN